MPIDREKRDDMPLVAALISKGFPLAGAEPKADRPGIVEFIILVGDQRRAEFEDLCAHADRRTGNYDFEVHLGRYEAAFGTLKDLVRLLTKETIHERRTDPARTGGAAVCA
jgi:hypothetical protein